MTCSATQVTLLYTSYDQLIINNTALYKAGYTRSSLTCGYRYIQLVDADTYLFLPEQIISGYKASLSSDYNGVWARCYLSNWWFLDWLLPEIALSFLGVQVYHNILIYVPHKPSQPRLADQYSVTILVIDALSQLNYKRSFPATLSVVESVPGILYQGHHRIGLNSYPNVMALLSGETGGVWPEDIPNRVGMYYIDQERQPLLSYVFRQHGYLTMQMEDVQNMGDFNRKGVVGFMQPPADIYYRAAFWAIVKSNFALLRNRLIGSSDCYACLQEQMQHKYQIPAIRDFLETYKDSPTFSFIHLAEYLHNDLNMAKHYDQDLAKMIQTLQNSSALKNTFFLLMGDHGFQRSDPPFIFTKQGTIEMNMPAFYLLPPEDFYTRHPDKYSNLVRNSELVTTFFDINQMIRDVLSLAVGQPATNIFKGFEGHGQSLFSRLSNRTCEEAEIPEEYCSCMEGVTSMDTGDKDLVRLSKALLTDVNNYLRNIQQCQELSLHRLDNASIKKTDKQSHISFQIYTLQKNAIFQAQILCGDSCTIKLTRLDWYSVTSQCLPHSLAHLAPLCICP